MLAASTHTFSKTCTGSCQVNLRIFKFIRNLVQELAEEELSEHRNEATQHTSNIRRLKAWLSNEDSLNGVHAPITERTDSLNDRNFIRDHCMMCDENVTNKCKQCQVHLCTEINAENNYNEMNCWEKFHSLKNIGTATRSG